MVLIPTRVERTLDESTCYDFDGFSVLFAVERDAYFVLSRHERYRPLRPPPDELIVDEYRMNSCSF